MGTVPATIDVLKCGRTGANKDNSKNNGNIEVVQKSTQNSNFKIPRYSKSSLKIEKFKLDENSQNPAPDKVIVKDETGRSLTLSPVTQLNNLQGMKFESEYEFFVREDGSCNANVLLEFKDGPVHFDNFPFKASELKPKTTLPPTTLAS